LVGAALRTTTEDARIDDGQSWLDQIRSFPDVTFATIVRRDTANVQAGRMPVSSRTSLTGPPATGLGTVGVAVISSAAQGPVGSASSTGAPVAVGDEPAALGRIGIGPAGPWVAVADGLVDGVAPATVAVSPPGSEPDPSRRRPIANTSANAVTRTIIRRNQ
jgi:hypothetical protein